MISYLSTNQNVIDNSPPGWRSRSHRQRATTWGLNAPASHDSIFSFKPVRMFQYFVQAARPHALIFHTARTHASILYSARTHALIFHSARPHTPTFYTVSLLTYVCPIQCLSHTLNLNFSHSLGSIFSLASPSHNSYFMRSQHDHNVTACSKFLFSAHAWLIQHFIQRACIAWFNIFFQSRSHVSIFRSGSAPTCFNISHSAHACFNIVFSAHSCFNISFSAPAYSNILYSQSTRMLQYCIQRAHML